MGELEKDANYYHRQMMELVADARNHGIFIVSVIENDDPISQTVGMEVISLGNPIRKFGLLCAAVEQVKRTL